MMCLIQQLKFGSVWFGLLLPIFAFITNPGQACSQEVQMDVSYDTVYVGNILGVRFAVENWQADMSDPDFGEFDIVGGPQMSSTMSYSRGQRSSSKSILIYLRPPDQPGEYLLPPVHFQGEGKEFTTEEKTIIVVENSDNIRQDPTITTDRPASPGRQYERSKPPRGERKRF